MESKYEFDYNRNPDIKKLWKSFAVMTKKINNRGFPVFAYICCRGTSNLFDRF